MLLIPRESHVSIALEGEIGGMQGDVILMQHRSVQNVEESRMQQADVPGVWFASYVFMAPNRGLDFSHGVCPSG